MYQTFGEEFYLGGEYVSRKGKLKRLALLDLLLIWGLILFIDYCRVCQFYQSPIFVMTAQAESYPATMNGAVSASYYGLGYCVDAHGYLALEEGSPCVVEYEYLLFGMLIRKGNRNH